MPNLTKRRDAGTLPSAFRRLSEQWRGPFPLRANPASQLSQALNLYVANEKSGAGEDSVQVFPVGSRKKLRTITEGLSTPDALAFDGSGNLYVANYGNATVTVYPPGGTSASETISQGISHPIALTIDGSGNLYVVNDGNPVTARQHNGLRRGRHSPANDHKGH